MIEEEQFTGVIEEEVTETLVEPTMEQPTREEPVKAEGTGRARSSTFRRISGPAEWG